MDVGSSLDATSGGIRNVVNALNKTEQKKQWNGLKENDSRWRNSWNSQKKKTR